MADKGPVDEKLKQAITEIEAQHYKVLTKEEYDHLMALHVTKEKPFGYSCGWFMVRFEDTD